MNILYKLKKIKDNNVLKSSFELLLVIVSVFVVSYAWFTTATENSAKDLTLKTKASRLLYISLDDGVTWDTEFSLDLNDNFKFNNEITGNGITFYKAHTKRDDGVPITFTEAVGGHDYVEFDLLFKANAALGVFLDSDSFVLPVAGDTSDKLIGNTVIRKSSYGDFSRDLIAGAVRISFTENDYVDENYVSKLEPSLVWAPNKNYELLYNSSIYSFDLESTNNQDYRYIDAGNGFNYKNVSNLKDNLNTDFDDDVAGGDPMITKIDPEVNDGIKSVTVRIWIEGNDREAHTALTGGIFRMNINFLGILKEENESEPDVSVDGNSILNYGEGMEYSIDYGNNWITYSEDNNPVIDSSIIVYVRYSETSLYFASDYVELEF